jgi:hypothetical protein
MKKPAPSTIVATPSAPAAFSAARHHAQEAFRLGSAAANHAILCGIELIRLREAQPELRGRTPSSGKKTDTIGVLSWPELVRREVGISDDTARQWMQAARNQLPAIAGALQIEATGPQIIEAVCEVIDQPAKQKSIAELFEGQTLEQLLLPLDGGGRLDISKLPPKKRERYDALSEAAFAGDAKAEALCRQIEAGTLDPGRAYAGWAGPSARPKARPAGPTPTTPTTSTPPSRNSPPPWSTTTTSTLRTRPR